MFEAAREVHGADAASVAWSRPGGWQTLRVEDGVLDDVDRAMAGLVEWTGSVVCVASVYAGDVALVKGLAPGGERWAACLNLELAAALWTPVPDSVDDTSLWVETPEFTEAVGRTRAELDAEVPGSARDALIWARAAGFGRAVEVDAIEEALRARRVFVEELLDAVLDRLGFPQEPDPEADGTSG
ncbi:hypothetical protein [Streptomyces violascens]|uniref:hypothetical protein n=1 Tax=Streptomyces violascens TaxID=67381 RepID=UPI003657C1BB